MSDESTELAAMRRGTYLQIAAHRTRIDILEFSKARLKDELTAARALLREFLIEVDDWHQSEWNYPADGDVADKVRSYLDACDTLGGNSEVGS